MKKVMVLAILLGLLVAGCSTFDPDPDYPEHGYHRVYYDPYSGIVVDVNCGMLSGSYNYDNCLIEVRTMVGG